MIEEIVSIELPVHEKWTVHKNRLAPGSLSGKEKRLSIVTGIHGDELDGQYICYEVIRRINSHPEKLKGIVDIYPDLNPLGLDIGSRGIPMFELDMNRSFPGSENGTMIEMLIKRIVDDLSDADMCIDIHASNIFLMEMPPVRHRQTQSAMILLYVPLL